MAIVDKNILKSYFETGDIPTQAQFIDLIDTLETHAEVKRYDIPNHNDVWVDVNSTTTIDYKQRELIIIHHDNKSYLLSASEIGIYGLNGIATGSGNFVRTDGKSAEAYALIFPHIFAVNPHEIDAATIGLGNVDNTADVDKPISAATQTALDNKADQDVVSNLADHIANDDRHLATDQNAALDANTDLNASNKVADWDNLTLVKDNANRLVFPVTNHGSTTLYKGQVVAPDETDEIVLADARYKTLSRLFAVLDQDLAPEESGVAVKLGKVEGFDTNGYTPGKKVHLGENGGYSVEEPIGRSYHAIVGVIEIGDPVDGAISVDTMVDNLSMEQSNTNGFSEEQRANTTLAVDELQREFSITGATYPFYFYNRGYQVDKWAVDSVVFPDVEGAHWFYYDRDELKTVANPTGFQKGQLINSHTLIAYIYWNATDKKIEFDIFDERHGFEMSPATHAYLHGEFGARLVYGFGLSGFTIGTGNANVDAQFAVDAGAMRDEDLLHFEVGIAIGGTIPVGYLVGANGDVRVEENPGYAFLSPIGGGLYYNEWTGTEWVKTAVVSGDYALAHVFAINGDLKNTISFMGQADYANITDAKEGASNEVGGLLVKLVAEEMVPVGTVILQTKTVFGNDMEVRVVEVDAGVYYEDWRTTELGKGIAPSSHNNLSDVEVAGTGVLKGHVDNTKPLQFPELTTVERDAITTPNGGMVIWNTTTTQAEIYNGSAWVAL